MNELMNEWFNKLNLKFIGKKSKNKNNKKRQKKRTEKVIANDIPLKMETITKGMITTRIPFISW